MQPQVKPGAIHIQPLRGLSILIFFMIDFVFYSIGKRYKRWWARWWASEQDGGQDGGQASKMVGKMVGKFVSTRGVETNLPTLHFYLM
ncbi:MAG: hypothetical protein DRR16_08980 [Candidatus Parabeggiatoa sp. nov. 3]|nr:MAG: hypothetical protein DRR00_01230 [Gammaproteobacteria bacterium]RKZ60972.1 MAG: hypothetical protein DRQ99_21210 [Gammaproteobacteria bacterium]RKZ86733.1 MAG: hypothetical protein DRR16_08980 [Gammaproteobacteria bacterium]